RDRHRLERFTQVGLARLARIWAPISGKPEIGVCSAPQRNQAYADCVNLSALLRCARDTCQDQPAAVGNDRRLRSIVSGLLFTMDGATPTCQAVGVCSAAHGWAVSSEAGIHVMAGAGEEAGARETRAAS